MDTEEDTDKDTDKDRDKDGDKDRDKDGDKDRDKDGDKDGDKELEIELSYLKSCMRWRRLLKGLSYGKGWVKSTDNLAPFWRHRLIDNTFSQRNLAGQSI
jgi:hypothetical protein